MRNPVSEAMKAGSELVYEAYKAAVAAGELPEAEPALPQMETPRDTKNGDYATGFAMQSARALRLAPKKIADTIVKYAEPTKYGFSAIEAAGPGFINLRLDHSWYEGVVSTILEKAADYGRTECEKPEKIMVEFVSANPTGPMHLGNARGGVLGDCLAEVLSRAGHNVEREFYVNDSGNQMAKFAQSVEARYLQHSDPSFPFPEDGYHGADIKEIADQYREIHGDSLEKVSTEERRAALSAFGLEKNLARMKHDLGRYGINYDTWFFESVLYDTHAIEETMELLDKAGALYEKEGAIWLRTTDFGCEKDDVLRRANGFYTYFAADIAYHRNKLVTRGFDRVINIWGADHHGHVARLQAALDALGLDGSHRLEIVLMQLVKLTSGGEAVRMSKRTGNAITLSTLLDEINRDAARFFFNSRAAASHLDFDLDLAVRQDSENPVYYVQYAHARIRSIIRSLEELGVSCDTEGADLSLLTDEAELDLIRLMSRLPEEIRLSAQSREPSRLNRYAETVSGEFHRFYTNCRIRDVEPELRKARVALITACAQVIENTLSTFGVSAPERM